MKKINTTKAAKEIQTRYEKSNIFELWQAYQTASGAKQLAFAYCKNLMRELNGYGLKIIGYNCHTFSAAFRFEDKDSVCCLAYITPSKYVYFEIA